MTQSQVTAVQILSQCRMYHPRERDRIKYLRLMMECDPDTEMDKWEDRKLFELLHKYRRQHGHCPCLSCCIEPFRSKAGGHNPHDRSLFEESEV